MKSSTRRGIIGTATMFLLLVAGTFVFILGEKFLENFKSH
jgi:hypothetical protein